jgi:flavin-dependent dehydrogenase
VRYDAIVIGAGPSGSSAAIALAQQGRAVAIIERADFPRRKVCGEFISAVNLQLLDRLGIGEAVLANAGPPVERLALFASGPGVEARMPRARINAFGRALGRDVLDTMLLQAAGDVGVDVFQPWRAVEIAKAGDVQSIRIEASGQSHILTAPVVIAAHGSWEQGKLASNLKKSNGDSDYFGFKATFKGGALASNLMPLLAFPGGYGGMVWTDESRISLSCCVRRDALATIRKASGNLPAGQAVYRHILAACPGVAQALADAKMERDWLAAGPIRPGIRPRYADDIFRVGNLAGESHPIIAEGISMALQSGWLLATELGRVADWAQASRAQAGRRYAKAWSKQFATRIYLASALAALAGLPPTADLMRRAVGLFPAVLSLGARLSGKTWDVPNAGELALGSGQDRGLDARLPPQS